MNKIYPYRIKTHTGARPTWTMMRLNLEHVCTERSKAHRKIISANFTRNLMEEKNREQNEYKIRLDEISRIEDSIRNGTDPYLKMGLDILIGEINKKPFGRGEEYLKEYKELLNKHAKMSLREKIAMKETYNIDDNIIVGS